MKRGLSVVFVVATLAAAPATAHHSVSAEFDTNKPIKFSGTIKKVDGPNLGAPVYSTPVVANGVIYIASNTHLYAFHDSSKSGTDEVPKVEVKPNQNR